MTLNNGTKRLILLTALCVLLLLGSILSGVCGWTIIRRTCRRHHSHNTVSTASVRLSQSLNPANEESWKAEGERIILEAAVGVGAMPEQVAVSWKVGRAIVTVDAAGIVEEDVANEGDDSKILLGDDEETTLSPQEDLSSKEAVVDVVSIARAINAAFDAEGEGSVGYSIAVHHEIEVTTPGASDELSGIMFEAYRGFPVVLSHIDPKTNKRKTVEGKLVERTDEYTQINVKGRMRKFKNYMVDSVKLPKPKKEKGVR